MLIPDADVALVIGRQGVDLRDTTRTGIPLHPRIATITGPFVGCQQAQKFKWANGVMSQAAPAELCHCEIDAALL
jgi:hypothetical protein